MQTPLKQAGFTELKNKKTIRIQFIPVYRELLRTEYYKQLMTSATTIHNRTYQLISKNNL